ncbi:hypothetical protein [Pedobacter sp. UYP30]|uniref:hypothetical protein n=1 Tax=Pedobacter sp. UYP30 TaxID=1756400 RepID=UPI0033923C1A
MSKHIKFYVFGLLCCFCTANVLAQEISKQKTSFQESSAYSNSFDIRTDIAMVYGISGRGGNFEERVKGYREKGYEVQFMTGIAWGEYQDYFLGKWDGKNHLDEGQVTVKGDTIWHGKNIPYIVPSDNYLSYMKSQVKRAIDAGVTAIYLEEPEFWARAGYSDAFKAEWQKYYGFAWMPQDKSAEATYLSSKLKYQLYFNALKQVFAYIKTYSESKGPRVKCYVPTHSLINYSLWEIVSPEASLANLEGMDGYIAQVWTGTAREPIFYNGLKKERVFENAFLEYGSMVSMTAATGRRVYFLTDPIEDRAHSWDDYKVNYQATFAAELLYPSVDTYEVMPWPNRIYNGKFTVEGMDGKQPISPAYATQMQVMVNSLNQMPKSNNKVNGSHGISVLLSNSMMFQRFPTHNGYDDPSLSNFYGMALPLLKQGIPVETVHMENLANANALKGVKVLIMSYANMKPLSASYHKELTKWVKNGGVLVYLGRDKDPFQTVKEWWNTNGNTFKTPSQHLFKLLGIADDGKAGKYSVGAGKVYVLRKDPKENVLEESGDALFLKTIKTAYQQEAKAGDLVIKNNFVLHRGPYIIAAVMDEGKDSKPLNLKGSFIDLFNPELPVINEKVIPLGSQGYLYDLSKTEDKQKPQTLATAARVTNETITNASYAFIAKSPENTNNIMRILLPGKPTAIHLTLDGKPLKIDKNTWDEKSSTLLLGFENFSRGVSVNITW